MAASILAPVDPALLRWARETIDLSQVAASRRIGVPDDRVEQWESGEVSPTIAQLKSAAGVYNRALAVFFLPEPPAAFDTLRDFRRHPGSRTAAWSPDLHAEYRRALTQREHVLELDELDDVAPATAWRIRPLPDTVKAIAATARQRLLETSTLPWPTSRADQYEHLNFWVAALETAGVLVMATAGGRVSTSEMRAMSLYFDEHPVVVVNGADAARGRTFSLLHEYAHLLLNTSGLCDTIADQVHTTPDRKIEARCNAIAAAILMPREQVLRLPAVVERAGDQASWDYEALADAARPFGVSAHAFLRRLLTLEVVDREFYRQQHDEMVARYEHESHAERPSGGNWYRNTVRDLGKGYVRLVADAHRRRVIDSYTAATYLNVKVDQIARLAQTAGMREAV